MCPTLFTTLAIAAGAVMASGPWSATWTAKEAAAASEVPTHEWSFDGIFGTFDRAALQRGYQVFAESCAACHSLRLLAYRIAVEVQGQYAAVIEKRAQVLEHFHA